MPPCFSTTLTGRAVDRRLRRVAVVMLLTTHAAMLAWMAFHDGATWDEVGHLGAGVSHWEFGRFELYRVNPPLVRMIAAVPVVLANPEMDWRGSRMTFGNDARGEFYFGIQMVEANGARYFQLLSLARCACIPLSLLGGFFCYRWATELYGMWPGMLALTLWAFSPNILAHGHLITPDAGAAALGVAACYAFWKWLLHPTWGVATLAGLAIGLAQLAKTTWIVLFALWPVLWLAWRAGEWRGKGEGRGVRGEGRGASGWRREAGQIGLILLLGLYVLNLGYRFEGSFQRLGDYQFVSEMLAWPDDGAAESRPNPRNRFAGTWLAAVPVPLPKNYLMGIDLQKWDFERKMWSYLRGEWRLGGWWYYYLYGLAIKEPLGTWALVLLAILLSGTAYNRERKRGRDPFVRSTLWAVPAKGSRPLFRPAGWRNELILLAPIAVVLTLVSSQTGFNHHLRYVLPIFPFAFIWMSKIARAIERRNWCVTSIAATALVWSIGSSLYYYPHSLSYFNELVGGPKGGHYHLGNSNMDWGQDLFYLKRWFDRHPEARPLTLAYDMPLIDPKLAGVESTGPPPLGAPVPGWHAISVNQIHNLSGQYEYFLRFEPVAMAGYSIYIYHITPDEANRVRRELGLPPLGEPPPTQSREGQRS